jgi:4a-hydroxytetrahydrobiopterin dehydratase
MVELYRRKCVACRSGDPSLSDEEILRWNREIPNWVVKEVAGIKRLERIFTFSNFVQAMMFINRAGQLAQQENHHPLMIIEYDKVTVNWWTHKVKGLHLNDFIMAAKLDDLMRSNPPR